MVGGEVPPIETIDEGLDMNATEVRRANVLPGEPGNSIGSGDAEAVIGVAVPVEAASTEKDPSTPACRSRSFQSLRKVEGMCGTLRR